MQNPCNKIWSSGGNRGANRVIILNNVGSVSHGKACSIKHRQEVLYSITKLNSVVINYTHTYIGVDFNRNVHLWINIGTNYSPRSWFCAAAIESKKYMHFFYFWMAWRGSLVKKYTLFLFIIKFICYDQMLFIWMRKCFFMKKT